jgi:hypothetical protein
MHRFGRFARITHRMHHQTRPAYVVASSKYTGHTCHLVLVDSDRAPIVNGDSRQIAARRKRYRIKTIRGLAPHRPLRQNSEPLTGRGLRLPLGSASPNFHLGTTNLHHPFRRIAFQR